MIMLKNYIKIAWRNVCRDKGYAFINIAGLATGIAVCLFILLFVAHELSYDRFHTKKDRIVRAIMNTSEESLAVTPSAVAPIIAQQVAEVESWVRLYEPTRYSPAIVRYQDKLFQESSLIYADSTFFDLFSFRLSAGNSAAALIRPNSIVLTRSMAEKYFGNDNPVGEVIEVTVDGGAEEFNVTGVMEDVPQNSHFRFDFLASLSTRQRWSQLTDDRLAAANFYTYLLLDKRSSVEPLKSKIPALLEKYVLDGYPLSIGLQPLSDIYLHSDQQAEIRPMGDILYVYSFSAIAVLVLIIACINYINLATARSARRAPEVAMRKALGAHRPQLIRQFYGESLLITVISILFAILVVEVAMPPLERLTGNEFTFSLFEAPLIWVALGIIIFFVSMAAGSYPALVLSAFQPSKALKSALGTGKRDAFYRKVLVVFQFAVSIFLVIGTLVINDQIQFIQSKNLGFDKEHVVILPTGDRQLSERFETLKAEVLRRPGVLAAAGMSNIPGDVFGGYSVSKEGMAEDENIHLAGGTAGPGVIATLGIRLLAGEDFPANPNYVSEQGYLYLINKKLSDALGWEPEEAIGKDFSLWESTPGRVAGVMENFNFASLREDIDPLALFLAPGMYDYLLVKIEPEHIPETLASLKSVWSRIAPHRPFEYTFLDQKFDALYQSEMRMAGIFSTFTMVAIFIACLGLIGLASYLVEQRTKEIGIRKASGATIPDIITLFSKDFVLLVIAGFIISIPIAWLVMSRWLQNFAYHVEIGFSIIFVAGLSTLIIALIAVSYQSLKAALMNPVESLRRE